jgi:hypothetical protein
MKSFSDQVVYLSYKWYKYLQKLQTKSKHYLAKQEKKMPQQKKWGIEA